MGLFSRKLAVVQPVVQGPVFAIPEVPQIPTLPEAIDKTKLDVRYPLIAPYVNAHIYWDTTLNEVIYAIEEPVLDPREKRILTLAEEGVRELINISFINIKTLNVVVEYLEKNLKIILDELGVKISRDTFVKIMYYIYRDFVGLNELEPLMRDFFIEDIECNGVNTPIYIVHRKYRNLRTTLIYPDMKKLTSFVEKLAQKCGKYISYASPLLDGSLPDGSRVNAVYTQEISARGPNFTVRKFTKEPWSPVQLMGFKTLSPELLAYLWLLIEHESSIMVIGGTGSGKTSFLNCIAFFIPPAARIVSIEDTKEIMLMHENWLPSVARAGMAIGGAEARGEVDLFALLKESFRQRPDYVIVGEVRGSIKGSEEIFIIDKGVTKRIPIKNLEFMNLSNIEVPTIDRNLRIKLSKIDRFIKHHSRDNLVEIKTKTGRKVTSSLDHSLFTADGCKVIPVETKNLKRGDQIIIPNKIPYGYNNLEYLNPIELYPNLRLANAQSVVKYCINKIGQNKANKLLGCLARQYCRKSVTTNIQINKFKILLNAAKCKFDIDNRNLRVTNGNGKQILAKIPLNEDFCRLLGYYIAEGSLEERSVVITNSNPIIINDVISISKKLFNISPKIRKIRGYGESNHITISSVILKKLIEDLCGRTINKRVPAVIYGLSKEKICAFLKGAFSGDGSFYDNEIAFDTKLKKLAEDISYLLLAINIVSRISRKRNNLYRIRFKRIEDAKKFLSEVGFIQKNPKVRQIGAVHSSVNKVKFTQSDLDSLKLPRKFRHLKRYKRCSKFYLNKVVNELKLDSYVGDFARGDFYIDEITSVKKLNKQDKFVYDISVPETQNFIGGYGGIMLHNSEAYVLFQGMASVDGDEKIFILNDEHLKQISIKELEGKNLSKIKVVTIDPETNEVKALPIHGFFKHPPRDMLYKVKTETGKEVITTPDHSVFTYTDKIIPKEVAELKEGDIIAVVEVKDKINNSKLKGEKIVDVKKIKLEKPREVYDISIPGFRNFVSATGILLHNSGHPSMGTMHAESVDTMIKRLESPPINLSPSLVETMDAVCIMTQAKVKDKIVRKVSEVNEIISVKEEGKSETNTPFKWDPRSDRFLFKRDSRIFDKIAMKRGFTREEMWREFDRRVKLLVKMYQLGIVGFKEVHDIISSYYKTPQRVIQQFGL